MRARLGGVVLVLLAVSLAWIDRAQAQAPDPLSVYVSSLSYVGSGCPQGSVGISISNDRKSFTLILDQFIASSGPNIDGSNAKKDCELTLLLNVPSGFLGGQVDFSYRGYQQLPAGLKVVEKRKYSGSKTAATTQVVGAVTRDYLYTDLVGFSKVKSCDGTPCMVAKMGVALAKSSTASAQTTVDSIDGRVSLSN